MSSNKRCKVSSSDEEIDSSYSARLAKSRDAAKKRRDLEAEEINKLASLLPFPEKITKGLDKGSILRLTVYYLRMKKYSQNVGQLLQIIGL